MENTGAGNMPVNFAQGMFMNGLYNPMSMMSSGDFMYNITYPGTRENNDTNVTGNDGNITIKGEDPFEGGDGEGVVKKDGDDPKPTANTEPEGGCGEGMKWDPLAVGDNDLQGACVEDKVQNEGDCTGGRKWNPVSLECECSDKNKPLWNASSKKCVAIPKTPPVNSPPYKTIGGVLLAMGITYANREKIAKYLVNRGIKNDKKAIQAAIQEISDKGLEGYFSNVADDAMEPLVGKNGQLLMGFYDDADVRTVSGPQNLNDLPGQNVADDLTEATAKNSSSGPMFDSEKPLGPKERPKLQAPEFTKREQRAIRQRFAAAKNNKKLLQQIVQEYKIPVGTPKGKAFSAKHLKTSIKNFFKNILEDGGAVDSMDEMYGNPDLYRFTGGGQGMDYFDEGGYYEDGGSTNDFEIMGQPAYKNVYDPYMPYANNGMVVDSSYQEEPSLNGSMQQGQEMYMSPQQVAQFMAAGGVVEFLD